jgi:hypothetical protein
MYSSPEEGWSLRSLHVDDREMKPRELPAKVQSDLRRLVGSIGDYGTLGTSKFPVESLTETMDVSESQSVVIVRPRLCRGGMQSSDTLQLTACRDEVQWTVSQSYTPGCQDVD